MTLNGAIMQLVEMRENSMMPVMFKPYFDKVIETISECVEPSEIPHWIPCSERLPEDNTVCLVTVDQYYIPSYVNQVDVMIYDSGKWLFYNVDDIDTDKTCLIPIIAWMPLPERYREGE